MARLLMSTAALLALLLCAPTFNGLVTQGREGCSFNINEDLPSPPPLILQDRPLPEFRYPNDGPKLRLRAGEALRLSCGNGSAFLLDKEATADAAVAVMDLRAECVGGQVVRAQGHELELHRLPCEHHVVSEAIPSGSCLGGLQRVVVGFSVAAGGGDVGLLNTLEICFDPVNLDAVYSRCMVSPKIENHETSVARPPFFAGPLYGDIDVGKLYKRKTQRQTLATLLGSKDLAAFYIKDRGDLYLARGHLTAKADLVYGPQQRGTFLYANTAPQWQSVNQGNWQRVEAGVRHLSVTRGIDLEVTTGVHGVAALPDAEGVPQPLYLLADGVRRGVRVPQYFWKAVRHPGSGAGVVIVGVNNPYQAVTQEDIFCEDVCDQLSWLHLPRRKSQVAGYVFCCEVDSFRRVVATLPPLSVDSLLD